MNKELCNVLKTRLLSLPFVDVLGGMVQTVTSVKSVDVEEEDGRTSVLKVTQRFPVTYDVIVPGIDCFGREWAMIPDSNRKSMIYFEEYGISLADRHHNMNQYNSTIRVVCWMNREKLVNDPYKEVSGPAMASTIHALTTLAPSNNGMFVKLKVTVSKIPPQDAAIFNRYSYDEDTRQYLRPPYEFFAIDLLCNYYVSDKCAEEIDWTQSSCM